jgi:serine/threonine protein kinase
MQAHGFWFKAGLYAQTQSILKSRADEICRGTAVYMSPEIHTGRLTNASQDDLKMVDIWSLGIVAYSMINPNLSIPYHQEFQSLGVY